MRSTKSSSWQVLFGLGLGVAGCSNPNVPSSSSSTSSGASLGSTSSGADDHDATGSTSQHVPDLPLFECDIFAQDCPVGTCTIWGSTGGDWDATRCRPVVDDPAEIGEPCHVESWPTSGIDDCDFGAMCWYIDHMTLEGTCVPICVGSAGDPSCADPERICPVGASGVPLVCLETCNPLQADCVDGQVCHPYGDFWYCNLDASGDLGAYGDPCAFINACDPGLICLNDAAVPPGQACEGSDNCCTEACDLDDPAGDLQCAGAAGGQLCQPWYEEGSAPPGFENVGACAMPT